MKILPASILAAFTLAAGGTNAAEPTLMSPENLAARAAQVTVFVPPEFPAKALREKVEAMVEVTGTVKKDGSLAVEKLEVAPDRAEFRDAVMAVEGYWRFRPDYDSACHAKEAPGQIRVWFELKDGKPSISITAPKKLASTPLAPSKLYPVVRQVDPWYPSAAWHDRIEARIEALMRVSDAGKVEEVVIVPGAYESQFGEAATTALMQWEFAPGKRPWHCYLHVLDFRPSDYKPRGHVIR